MRTTISMLLAVSIYAQAICCMMGCSLLSLSKMVIKFKQKHYSDIICIQM